MVDIQMTTREGKSTFFENRAQTLGLHRYEITCVKDTTLTAWR